MFGFGGGSHRRGGPTGPQRGSDIYTEVKITLEEAFNGVEKEVKIRRSKICPTCNGKNQNQVLNQKPVQHVTEQDK